MPTLNKSSKRFWEVNLQKESSSWAANEEDSSFYKSKDWKLIREQVLMEANWCCVYCLFEGKTRSGNVCDHIIPVRFNPDLKLDIRNLQCLCAKHHNKKSNYESRNQVDSLTQEIYDIQYLGDPGSVICDFNHSHIE
ncbi:HNH endonuclease [Marinifilum flexuosum]|uniref:HNH endonuclease n=1 Tax=Marinifilum flexuosum TaxID=1117708 RepID=UPI002493E635|nr:HNH endonuclease signature motif containing protein [Marinifilum flexuosum]